MLDSTNSWKRGGEWALRSAWLMAVVALAVAAPVVASQSSAAPEVNAGGVRFQLGGEDQPWRVTVSGPGGYYLNRTSSGPDLTVPLWQQGEALPTDGTYIWEVRHLDSGERESGAFLVVAGAVVFPDDAEHERQTGEAAATPGSGPDPQGGTLTHVGDVYIDGALAFGPDITGIESVGGLSMLVEENNIRVRFDDTSVDPSFPDNDWQITLNGSSMGSGEYFAIEDRSGSTVPLRIDAGAGEDTLRLDQNSRVGIGTATPAATLHVNGSATVEGEFSVLSSRSAKQGFTPVDPAAVLERLAQLPLTEWSYRADGGVRHLGPVSEEFYSAFALGRDERTVNPLDLAGVALAAIQGLRSELIEERQRAEAIRELLDQRAARIARLESDREALDRRVGALEELLRELAER